VKIELPARRRTRLLPLLALAVLVAAACGTAAPTPIYVYLTPTPGPTATPTPSPTPEPTPSPTPTPNLSSPTAVITAAPTPTPNTGPTLAPPVGTGSAACTGGTSNKAWWADAPNHVAFSVYCGAMSSGGWALEKAGSVYDPNGTIVAVYKTSAGGIVVLLEGAFCVSGKPCPGHGASAGAAKIGTIGATVYSLNAGYAVNVPGATPAPWLTMGAGQVVIGTSGSAGYAVLGNNVTQATLTAISGYLVKVPKS
jgi:hypothetical protein